MLLMLNLCTQLATHGLCISKVISTREVQLAVIIKRHRIICLWCRVQSNNTKPVGNKGFSVAPQGAH